MNNCVGGASIDSHSQSWSGNETTHFVKACILGNSQIYTHKSHFQDHVKLPDASVQSCMSRANPEGGGGGGGSMVHVDGYKYICTMHKQ